MEVPIITYSLLLIAILALNITAHFVLRDGASEGQAKDMPAPHGSPQEEGATPSLVAKVGEILGTGEQRLAIAHQGKRQLGDEMVAKWVNSALKQGILKDEEAARVIGWWSQRPEAVSLGRGIVSRRSVQPLAEPLSWQHEVDMATRLDSTAEIPGIEQEERIDALKKARQKRAHVSGQRDEGLRSGTGYRRL